MPQHVVQVQRKPAPPTGAPLSLYNSLAQTPPRTKVVRSAGTPPRTPLALPQASSQPQPANPTLQKQRAAASYPQGCKAERPPSSRMPLLCVWQSTTATCCTTASTGAKLTSYRRPKLLRPKMWSWSPPQLPRLLWQHPQQQQEQQHLLVAAGRKQAC